MDDCKACGSPHHTDVESVISGMVAMGDPVKLLDHRDAKIDMSVPTESTVTLVLIQTFGGTHYQPGYLVFAIAYLQVPILIASFIPATAAQITATTLGFFPEWEPAKEFWVRHTDMILHNGGKVKIPL